MRWVASPWAAASAAESWAAANDGESEKRQALRYPLELAVELPDGSGRSRDVSASGVFVETEEAVSSISPIKFSLVLGQTGHGAALRLYCEGRVVRVARRNGKAGVAVALTSYR